MKRKLKVGVVGATGMVGQTFMNILSERSFPIEELRPFASENSLGKKIELQGQQWPCQVLKDGCFDGLDLVFFSSGDDISAEWAPKAVAAGAFAVDNSAAFRMDPNTVLIVPEVNGDLVNKDSKPQIIANPNCSTIQLVVALKPLLEKFGLEEVRVSTYQAVSGAGQGGHDELIEQTTNHPKPTDPKTFPHTILFNCIPQIGSFNDEGYCSEEVKIMKETRKILGQKDLKVSAFTVRIPALNAHSESVWVTLNKSVSRDEVMAALSGQEGIVVQDEPKKSVYPLARDVSGKDPVYVGRVHRDPENPKMWLMWVVSDNIRKGAALNGIQIAEKIFFN
ncbi:aspartate-semialdehyde dehydrogenase [Bdellovibrio bacteriovorus]|uniref:aspartate-semialdehyde dehydrogenase n=1 Tax=Bdellovibrio bacteriovorus TaxID=959 RepID=UPI000308565B|nr:aspartate-semialdehyde dehydrogenase [Bdellovibrio bacteriovorus]AHZ86098.1 aspartate-semialdehyde dehydrogenase [Bdellovibrio bacteriovorus]BEV67023.1 Aspartate-semialdehyde dehydrogenase [Bdellovibrio bacteriovorus]